MTTKDDFSEEEWARIVRAPFVAGLAVSMADPGGPIEVAKESVAMIKAASDPSSREQLVAAVALDLQVEVKEKRNPLKGFRASVDGEGSAGEQVLAELRGVCSIVAGRATQAETAAFGQWLVDVAQAAADAAKEGGFMGFRAEQVSAREQQTLDAVRAAVAPS